MRFLGIDYGTKRIGLSISDEEGQIAFPKEIIPNDRDALRRIGEVVKKEKVSTIVVGESTNFAGLPNKVALEADSFTEELKVKFNIPVEKQKEFLTSVEARRYGEKGEVDHSAAALILQRFLDRKNKK